MNLDQFTIHITKALTERLEHDWPPPPWPWPKQATRRQLAADTLISGIRGLAAGLTAEAEARARAQNAIIEGLRAKVRTLERVADDRLDTIAELKQLPPMT